MTVLFNITLFYLLDLIGLKVLIANTIAFILSVLFAYLTNTKFVFQSDYTWKNFRQFFFMRIGTILIDNFGMLLFISIGINKLFAKMVVNAVIIVLNYIFSKFIIYKPKNS